MASPLWPSAIDTTTRAFSTFSSLEERVMIFALVTHVAKWADEDSNVLSRDVSHAMMPARFFVKLNLVDKYNLIPTRDT